MNKQTLHYHTRLHDWYRQHCIQQEKQHTTTHAQPSQSTMCKTGHHKSTEAIRQGCLTSDKMYAIGEWCTEVNRTLFCIKKKESSPLYRKCKLSASTKSAITTKPTDPRRVKSAEVFTRTGLWSKQPKPLLRGGEFLSKQQGSSEQGSKIGMRVSAAAMPSANQSKVEFCVRNSKEINNNNKPEYSDDDNLFPRVNHDSLNVRNNTMTQNQHTDKMGDKSLVLSPRFIPDSLHKPTTTELGQGQKAKTVTVSYVINNLVREDDQKELIKNHSELERAKNVKNTENSKKNRIFSASQRSVKTADINSSVLGGDDSKVVLNAVVKFCDHDAIPTFCNTCSGIYSGNAPPPPTPATCASCIHGINLLGKDLLRQPPVGPSQAQIQKELAQKLVHTEKVYGERITSAKIELKMSETRLTEDSVHYSAEREMLRNVNAKPGLSMPNTFDDLEDERNISFQDDGSNLSGHNGKCSGSNISMDSPLGEKTSETSMDKGDEDKEEQYAILNERGDISNKMYSKDLQNIGNSYHSLHEKANGLTSNHDGQDEENPKEPIGRQGSRRMSISFSYKPEVSNISTSNHLLRVLSIDDCKMGMRYTPHRILEDHEVADDQMADRKPKMGMIGSDFEDMEGDSSQVAMRLSQNSSITSLHSSSANDATVANKMHYKILFGPEDLNQYHNLRPRSAYLTKAFQTMINDRTIMQRLDRPGSSDKAKNSCTIARTIEGPKYKIINTALKREMGNMLQAQRQKVLQRYEQQKRCAQTAKSKQLRSASRLSESTGKSLSLDSLPSMKKGILKHTE